MGDTVNKIYGKRLKEIRTKKHYTQEFLANSVDIRTATISDFENGKTSIKLDILNSICSILNITLKEFFNFDSLSSDASKEELILDINSYLKNLGTDKLKYIKTMSIMFDNDNIK